MTVPGAARECARPCARLGREHGPLVARPQAPLDNLFHAVTETQTARNGNGTRSLIRFGCLNWESLRCAARDSNPEPLP
jgi:hypothetical protein